MKLINFLLIFGVVVLASFLICHSKDGYTDVVHGRFPITQASVRYGGGIGFNTDKPTFEKHARVVITGGSPKVKYPVILGGNWTIINGNPRVMGLSILSIQNDPVAMNFYDSFPADEAEITGYVQT